MCEYSIPQFIFAHNVEWAADIKTKHLHLAQIMR